MLIIRDRNDTFGLGALGGSLGFLLGALGGSWPHFGCSAWFFGVSWGLLGVLLGALGARLLSFWVPSGAP